MPIDVPTKTEESLGIEKRDNVPEGAYLDPRYWTKAEQYELLKTKLIELCELFNALEVAGGLGGLTQLTGDVTAGPGTGSAAATVARLRGRDFSTDPPVQGVAVVWNGSEYGAEGLPIREVVGNAKLLETDLIVSIDNSAADALIEGPDLVLNARRAWIVKKNPGTTTNKLTLTQAGSELIENVAAALDLPGSATSSAVGPSYTVVRTDAGNLFLLG